MLLSEKKVPFRKEVPGPAGVVLLLHRSYCIGIRILPFLRLKCTCTGCTCSKDVGEQFVGVLRVQRDGSVRKSQLAAVVFPKN